MKNFYQKGISLLEAIIVIAIIAILAAIVLPGFNKIKERQVLKNASEEIIATLNKARSQSLASLDSSVYGVHFDSNEIVLFKGDTYLADSGENEVIEIIAPATITYVALAGGVVDVYFNRLTGTPSTTGAITVANSTDTKTITISNTGTNSVN